MALILFNAIVIIHLIQPCRQQPIQIFMAGDSTMATKPLEKAVYDSISGDTILVSYMERGWGQLLSEFFSEKIIVRNYAQNGRSSRTFIEQGWWDSITNNVKPNDYVIIQFGHNDSAQDRPDRYTSPFDYTKNMSRFVEDIQAKGANPIICTSVARRKFDDAGNLIDSHGEYLELARKVAKDKNVPLIDMYEKSKKALIGLGKENSKELFLHVPKGESPIFPEGRIDNTHFREKGALLMDLLFIEGLKEQNIESLVKELK